MSLNNQQKLSALKVIKGDPNVKVDPGLLSTKQEQLGAKVEYPPGIKRGDEYAPDLAGKFGAGSNNPMPSYPDDSDGAGPSLPPDHIDQEDAWTVIRSYF